MKLKFSIEGKKTHDVGYRVLLINKALTLAVNNFYTFNTFIDDVQVVIAMIEADDEIIEEFKAFIHTTRPKDAEVESINVEEYKSSIPPIERCMQAFQMEQCGKAIQILSKRLEKHGNKLELQNSIVTIKAERE